MGNVNEALRRSQAEQAEQPEPRPADAAPEDRQTAPPVAGKPGSAPAAKRQQDAGRRSTTTVDRSSASSNGYSSALMVHHDRGSMIAEQYRVLRTNLLAQYPDKRFCLMVTSAEAGEGKTVTSLNLGVSLTEIHESRIVIVDCDLRKRRIAQMLRMPSAPGLVDALGLKLQMMDCVRPTVYPNLDVLPAGQCEGADVGKLLGGTKIEEVMTELRRHYDFVLVDTPPINVASDAGMLGGCVTDALIVVRMSKTRRESVDKAIRLLHAANIEPVGMVLTHQKFYIPHYLYRYS